MTVLCPSCGGPLPAFPSLWVTTRNPSTECCSPACARSEQTREIDRTDTRPETTT